MNFTLSTFVTASLTAACLASSAQAQTVLDFPMDELGTAVLPGVLELQPRSFQLAGLAAHDDLILNRVPVPNGNDVVLELTQVRPDFSGMRVYVDGQERAWDRGDMTMWKGQVMGETVGSARITFSSTGCYGNYTIGNERYNISSFANTPDEWALASVRIYSETLNTTAPGILPKTFQCAADQLARLAPGANLPTAAQGGGPLPQGGAQTLECKVAVETDYPYYQHFNNLPAATNYMTQLLGAISDRYDEQVDVVLTYPYVQFYTSNNDPWTAYSSIGALLNQFESTWGSNLPNGAHLGHIVSGAYLGGGLASLDVLCQPWWGMGCSAGVDGGTNFPVNQGSDTWDFVVIAHELGHQFGTPHTHSYNPQIDQCGSGGPCQVGTIMSYCHTCSFAGMNNITTYFHPTVVANMRADAEQSCIPVYVPPCVEDGFEPNNNCSSGALIGAGTLNGLQAVQGNRDWFDVSVPNGLDLSVTVNFTDATGDIDMRLFDNFCINQLDGSLGVGNSETVSWTNNTGSTQLARIEVWLADASSCNGYSMTTTLQADPCSAPDDSFEPNDSCAQAAPFGSGFESGLFVRKTDPDYYSLCLATGATATFDAIFSQSDGDVDMYLYGPLNCPNGPILSLASSATSTNNESISWTNNSGSPKELVLEVIVRASSSGDCVGYDLVAGYTAGSCGGPPVPGPIGTNFCSPANGNSSGGPADISAFGFTAVSAQDVTLTTTSMPANQFGFYLVSEDVAFIPNPGGSAGILCLGGDIGRYQDFVQSSGAAGSISLAIDLTDIPTNPSQSVMVGQTFHFQTWFRDVILGTPTSNFSSGITIAFD